MKHLKVKQRDITDCGAACIASVAAYYKLKLPVAQIRQMAFTDKKGTTALGLIEAAKNLNFTAKGFKGTIEQLKSVPLPAIAHVTVKEGLLHYVVIYKITNKYIMIMDPGDGEMHKLSYERFNIEWSGVIIVLQPDEGFETGNKKISNISRFWALIKPHRSIMIQAIFGAAIATILGLSTSIYVQQLIDKVLPDSNQNLLNLLSVIMLVLIVMQVFVGYTKSVFALKTGQCIDARLILGYYKHLLKLPQNFFDTMRVGEILSRVNDAVKIRAFINDIAINMIVNLLVVAFSFALMFTYYWKLALICLLIIPVYSLLYYISNRLNKKIQRQLMEDSAGLETQLVESLSSVATIKRFGIEEHANVKTEMRFVQLLKSVFRSGIQGLGISNNADFFTKVFTVIVLWAGSYYAFSGAISPGELLSFYALIGYFTGPVTQLIGSNKAMQDALIAADRLFEIMDLDREENTNKIKLTKEQIGNIIFDNVSFRYGGRNQVFSDLSLTIEKGEVTAIVGQSGSGKSTLSALMQHIYPIQSGSIRLGSLDIKHIDSNSLKQMIAIVPQQIDLFAGTIIDNLILDDYAPDISKLLAICQLVGVHEFVEKLPNGFYTMLGEHGANLSGGQRQRLAIVRALYRNPEILILDEATSSLDPVAEQYIQHTIATLKQAGKTIIIIAHRLSTIKSADHIIVLENGKVEEQGLHESLITQNGAYSKLWNYHIGHTN